MADFLCSLLLPCTFDISVALSFLVATSVLQPSSISSMNRPSFNFDIDYYVNRIVPRSRLHLLPKSISWFLGYREGPQRQIGNVLIWFWAFLGAFVGILVVEAVFQSDLVAAHGTPVIIASFVSSPSCF